MFSNSLFYLGVIGKLLRHTDYFYSLLETKNEIIIEALGLCLVSGETDVKKVWRQIVL